MSNAVWGQPGSVSAAKRHWVRILTTRGMLALSLALLLSACSSVPNYGSIPESLSIDVLPNTTKQFVYRVGLPAAAEAKMPSHVPAGRPPGKRDYRKLQNRTAFVVAATGYCRSGYIQLDFRLSNQVQWIRGECREAASEVDIEAFGEKKQLSLKNLSED